MRCQKCNVEILEDRTKCPLCQEILTGEMPGNGWNFPVIPYRVQVKKLLLNIVSLISVIVAVVCGALNLSIAGSRGWSLFVIGGILCLWLSLAMVIRKMGNIPKTIFLQVLLICAAAIVWDLGTGFHRWSLDFVVPILCICSLIAMVVIAQIMKLEINDYLIYLIMDIFIGIVSVVLIFCGVLTVVLPTALSAAGSIIFLTALILFEGKALGSEMHRRMHIR